MIYVFEVRIRPGHTADQYAAAWQKASEIIQRSPGALGTRLHRKIGDDRTLLAIASWTSKKQRDTMEASQPREVKEILATQADFVDVNFIGEFDDPEWVVLPNP